MTEAILNELREIYPQETAQTVYKALLKRLDAHPPGQAAPERFSEQDAVLITYGDTLQRDGETPLQTLHTFASQHLQGAFSHIHILPFYPFSSDDGFSVKDFYAVNPALGSWEDVQRLTNDFDLMFDAVFNHMSAQSGWFAQFLAREAGCDQMFVTAAPDTDLSMVTRPRTSPLLTPFTRPDGEVANVWTTFSADQVDINYADPTTLLRMLDVLLFYVAQGAKMIRLDAIAYLWKVPGTSSIHLPQTHAVIRLMRAVLDVVAPETVIITETNVPHAENVTYFGNGHDEAQMIYNFTLPPLLFHTMLTGDCTKLAAWIKTLSTPSPQTTFFNFTASHDGIGVRPVEDTLSKDEIAAMIAHTQARGGRVSYKTNSDGSQSPYELNITYVDAVTDATEPEALQVRRFLVTQAAAMAMAGVPAVYIHSLLGSHNDIAGMKQTGSNRRINRAQINYTQLVAELEKPASFRSGVFTGMKHLLTTRRQSPAFHPNSVLEVIDTGSNAVLGLLRTASTGERLLALHNVTGNTQPVRTAKIKAASASDILTDTAYDLPHLTLEAYQVLWLRLA